MYRLYVDEVGTDGLTHLDVDKHRYLSLTGIAMQCGYAGDILTPFLNNIKSNILKHDPDFPVTLHRKEIMGFKGVYQCLRDENLRSEFDQAILQMYQETEYTVITALIDKQWMLRQNHWIKSHPYHYLMEILVEKYAQFLERKNGIGDIMPESRHGKNKHLQNSFESIMNAGTDFVSAERLASVIRAKNLKFRDKSHNISGLQLCDLLAHPSHIYTRSLMKHEVTLGPFATRIVGILRHNKYDRSPWNGKIVGYGIKHLPQ